MPRYNNERKEAIESNETEGVYALKLFDTSVTPSSKYGIKIWGFKGLKSWDKQTYIFTNIF